MVIHTSGGKVGNVTVPPNTMNTQMTRFFQSFDYETMNMAMHQVQNISQGSYNSQIQTDSILNWKAGHMTVHTKSLMNDQKAHETCKTVKLPFFLRFLPIGRIMEKMKNIESEFFRCVGHHDDVDEFAFGMQFPPKWVPKFMMPKSARVNLTMDIAVDAAGIMKSYNLVEAVRMDVKMNMNGKIETMHNMTSQVHQDMAFTKTRAGGPSEEDLKVPAEWGDCSTLTLMPELDDLLAEWERSDSQFFGHTRIIPHTLRAMMAEAKASTVVV